MIEKLFTAKEVAVMLRMESKTSAIKIAQWANAKRITGTKPGKSWLFTQADIDAYLRKKRNRR